MRRSLVTFTLGLLCSCVSNRVGLRASAPVDAVALEAAAEAFYRAETPVALHEAVDRARTAGKDSALFHELAASLASLEGLDAEELLHLVAALRDLDNPTPVLHLHRLMNGDFTFAQRELVEGLLRDLVAEHQDPEVRSVAASHLASMLTSDGQLAERDQLIAEQPGRFALSAVGTWDNDQGKGFDQQLAPETRSGLDQTYDGRFGPLAWRRDLPLDPRGRLELSSLMTPGRFAVAFVQGQAVAPSDGFYHLRLYSSGPLKVWVDGKLLFSASLLERSVWDNVVVPLKLTKGPHTVLIKSAHKEGAWSLAARLVPAKSLPRPVPDLLAMVDFRVRAQPALAARTLAHRASWAHLGAGGSLAVRVADAFAAQFPTSIVARAAQVEALWFNQERGRTGDALAALDRGVGDELPFVRLRQLLFQQQQGLKQKARDRLIALTQARPELADAWALLADSHRSDGWAEDELAVVQARLARFGDSPDGLLDLSRVLLRLGRRDDALAVLEDLRAALPLHPEVLRRLIDLATDEGALDRAAALLEQRLDSWPTDFGAWMQLAELRRRQQDGPGALLALGKAQALAPDASGPWVKRGDLAYERRDVATAVASWKKALDRNPENEALANRVEFLAPEARGPWLADVPDDDALADAVAARAQLTPAPGADVAFLLDDEVTQLNTDGSTSNVVTLVLHAFNAQGRDRIIKQTVAAGRLRLFHSYSIDEKGNRSEASSERSRQIFFRSLQPGSTLVLQYRLDVPATGYLSRYLTRSWSFQSASDQRRVARYVLWMPLGTTLNESRVGAIARQEARRGEQLRVEWAARDSRPLLAEPSMPPLLELATNLRLSTVPDWPTYLSWERSLLDGVFRDSPELDAVAKTLGVGATSADEKLKRVHQYVMEEIRYQQDYESFIAGVKPHPAPMVLERRYGDCKDKAVLFIELAKKLGLEAHFANVRTRDAGPIAADVPMQQFNHAIVYVPAQGDLAQGRFFDPTADMLDLDVVRQDDVGTRSLVINPVTGEHTFREIQFQAPEKHRLRSQLDLALGDDGSAKGRFTLEAEGRSGSGFRVASRDAEQFKQVVQRIVTGLLPNATSRDVTVVEAKDLRAPAVLQASIEAATFARAEADTLRIKLPISWNPRSQFSLASRRHPLVLGAPFVDEATVSVTLPPGLEVKKLPQAGSTGLPCLTLERTVSSVGPRITSTATFRVTCERITPSDYPAYRASVDAMMRMLEDELVVGKAQGPAARKPVPARVR